MKNEIIDDIDELFKIVGESLTGKSKLEKFNFESYLSFSKKTKDGYKLDLFKKQFDKFLRVFNNPSKYSELRKHEITDYSNFKTKLEKLKSEIDSSIILKNFDDLINYRSSIKDKDDKVEKSTEKTIEDNINKIFEIVGDSDEIKNYEDYCDLIEVAKKDNSKLNKLIHFHKSLQGYFNRYNGYDFHITFNEKDNVSKDVLEDGEKSKKIKECLDNLNKIGKSGGFKITTPDALIKLGGSIKKIFNSNVSKKSAEEYRMKPLPDNPDNKVSKINPKTEIIKGKKEIRKQIMEFIASGVCTASFIATFWTTVIVIFAGAGMWYVPLIPGAIMAVSGYIASDAIKKKIAKWREKRKSKKSKETKEESKEIESKVSKLAMGKEKNSERVETPTPDLETGKEAEIDSTLAGLPDEKDKPLESAETPTSDLETEKTAEIDSTLAGLPDEKDKSLEPAGRTDGKKAVTESETADIHDSGLDAKKDDLEFPVKWNINMGLITPKDMKNIMERYKADGYYKNVYGRYFNPWIDDFDENYSPFEDKEYNPLAGSITSDEKEKIMERYKADGYYKNVYGRYFNPWIDDFDENYNPLNDRKFVDDVLKKERLSKDKNINSDEAIDKDADVEKGKKTEEQKLNNEKKLQLLKGVKEELRRSIEEEKKKNEQSQEFNYQEIYGGRTNEDLIEQYKAVQDLISYAQRQLSNPLVSDKDKIDIMNHMQELKNEGKFILDLSTERWNGALKESNFENDMDSSERKK